MGCSEFSVLEFLWPTFISQEQVKAGPIFEWNECLQLIESPELGRDSRSLISTRPSQIQLVFTRGCAHGTGWCHGSESRVMIVPMCLLLGSLCLIGLVSLPVWGGCHLGNVPFLFSVLICCFSYLMSSSFLDYPLVWEVHSLSFLKKGERFYVTLFIWQCFWT